MKKVILTLEYFAILMPIILFFFMLFDRQMPNSGRCECILLIILCIVFIIKSNTYKKSDNLKGKNCPKEEIKLHN